MTKFKIGDKVKIVKAKVFSNDCNGLYGDIIRIEIGAIFPYILKVHNKPNVGNIAPNYCDEEIIKVGSKNEKWEDVLMKDNI